MLSVEFEEKIDDKPKSPEGQVRHRENLGGPGGVSNRMVSEEADRQRLTLRPTEDAAFQRLDKWPQVN